MGSMGVKKLNRLESAQKFYASRGCCQMHAHTPMQYSVCNTYIFGLQVLGSLCCGGRVMSLIITPTQCQSVLYSASIVILFNYYKVYWMIALHQSHWKSPLKEGEKLLERD